MKKHFFKILFLTACFVSSYMNSNAQVDTAKAEKLKGQLIDSICACVSKSDVSNIKTVDDAQSLLTKCSMSKNVQTLFMQYLLTSGIDLTDMNAMAKLSLEMSMKCPEMMTIMMNIASDTTQLNKAMDQLNKIQSMSPDNKNNEIQKN